MLTIDNAHAMPEPGRGQRRRYWTGVAGTRSPACPTDTEAYAQHTR
jgi:hypothetical protein